jgi:hypothetical protein
MREPTKKERRALRDLLGTAYERELGRALEVVEEAFGAWRRGEIDAFDVNDAIHRHHQGASRELWKRYEIGGNELLIFLVAQAVSREALALEEIPRSLRETIEERIALDEKIFRRL